MRMKLTKCNKVTLWISLPVILYTLFLLIMYWFVDPVFAGYHGWLVFPAVALGYMWFIAQRYGPLWVFLVLLLCMVVELILTAGRDGLELSSLWQWMGGPTLWGPIIGYAIGSVVYIFRPKEKATAE